MNKSNLVPGLLCLTAVASLSGVAMTQENDFGTIEEPLRNDEGRMPESEDRRLFDEVPDEPNSSGDFDRYPNDRERFVDPRQPQLNRPDVRPISKAKPRVMRPRQRSRTVLETVMEVVPPEEVAENRKLQAAIKSLKTSKSESEKKKAADIISAQLKLQFERDLKKREEELAKVEERVRSLREQLDKRKAAQDDIITLRLQTLVNDANGLGFPTNNFGGSSTSGSYFPGAAVLNQFAPPTYDRFEEPSFDTRRDVDEGLFFDRTEDLPRERTPSFDDRPSRGR